MSFYDALLRSLYPAYVPWKKKIIYRLPVPGEGEALRRVKPDEAERSLRQVGALFPSWGCKNYIRRCIQGITI